ncbi:hypothetical protein QQZ08_009914 [Neonectria magnoliae]|uniref:Uncharacterized protein n=1 Tax=Neonectria magnoliae TaxID=2732573 RepID=A0ABR1HKC8_9HYPO
MSAEARLIYDMTREAWLKAATQARAVKQSAKEAYDEEKENGLTDQTFDNWAAYPPLSASYQHFQQSEAAYQQAGQRYGSDEFKKWQEEYQSLRTKALYGDGEDKGSKFLIITPEK